MNCDSWCQLAGPVANCCDGHATLQPAEGSIAMLKSAVMPALAQAMTVSQTTAARSAGLLATPARIRALYDRANRRNVPVSTVTPLIHVLGSGNQSLLSPGGAAADARAIAESK